MFWSPRGAFSRFEDTPERQSTGGRVISAYLGDALEDVARVMFALRSEDLDSAALENETGIVPNKLATLLPLLELAGYVGREGDNYVSTAVILSNEDEAMIHEMLREGRGIITDWHEKNYTRIKETLGNLTPLRHGVPYGRVYTEVWHFLFGIANRTLVEDGLFGDPYSEDRPTKGFLPAVEANGLSELAF